MLLLLVHPPKILQNRRDFLFIQVARSNFYELAFTKKTTHLLEPPSKTMCVKYNEDPYLIHEGLKNRDLCISTCIHKLDEKKCANYYSVLVDGLFCKQKNKQKICVHEQQVTKEKTGI